MAWLKVAKKLGGRAWSYLRTTSSAWLKPPIASSRSHIERAVPLTLRPLDFFPLSSFIRLSYFCSTSPRPFGHPTPICQTQKELAALGVLELLPLRAKARNSIATIDAESFRPRIACSYLTLTSVVDFISSNNCEKLCESQFTTGSPHH